MVALAMANWCFVRAWTHLLSDGNRFFDRQPVLPVELLALAVNILGAALLFWLGIAVWRRTPRGLGTMALELAFLFLLALPADFIRTQVFNLTDSALLSILKRPAVILCFLAVLICILWKHRSIARAVAVIIVVTFPVALWTLAKIILVGFNLVHPDVCSNTVAPPPLLPVRDSRPRVIWIIFDETDYRMAFAQRPSRIHLPEFDRLRQVSLSADHAYAPADMTIISMPALISGRRLNNTFPDGCGLSLQPADGRTNVDWTALPSVFSDARALGFNTGLVGWYIPYQRLIGGSLNYCSWYSAPGFTVADATTFDGSIEEQIASIAWPFHSRQIFTRICQNSLKDGLGLVANPTYGLVLLHLPPPHAPGVYLPAKNQFTCLGIHNPAAYLYNLALADHELGALRRAMEAAGQWDKSWLILSADHSWRFSQTYDGVRDYRIPYLVKPPGDNPFLNYTNQFNTVLTRDFIASILSRQVTNQAGAAGWLTAHGQPDLPVKQSHPMRE